MKNFVWALTIKEQFEFWSKMLPSMGRWLPDEECRLPQGFPQDVPGVMIPNPTAIAGDYYAATRRMFRMLYEIHGTGMHFVDFHGCGCGQHQDMAYMECHVTPERLRLRPRTLRAYRLLGLERHRYCWWKFGLCFGAERSGLIPEVRSKLASNEFGLGPYEAACLFLLLPTHLPEFESSLVAIGCDYRAESEDDVSNQPEREIGYFRHSLCFFDYHNAVNVHGHDFGWGVSTRVLTGYLDRNLSKYEA